MLGIDKIKDALLACIEFGEALAARLEDGKVTTWEMITLIPKVLPIVQALRETKEIIAEFKDLTEEEVAELTVFVAENLDLEDDELEAAIEGGWAILLGIIFYLTNVAKN